MGIGSLGIGTSASEVLFAPANDGSGAPHRDAPDDRAESSSTNRGAEAAQASANDMFVKSLLADNKLPFGLYKRLVEQYLAPHFEWSSLSGFARDVDDLMRETDRPSRLSREPAATIDRIVAAPGFSCLPPVVQRNVLFRSLDATSEDALLLALDAVHEATVLTDAEKQTLIENVLTKTIALLVHNSIPIKPIFKRVLRNGTLHDYQLDGFLRDSMSFYPPFIPVRALAVLRDPECAISLERQLAIVNGAKDDRHASPDAIARLDIAIVEIERERDRVAPSGAAR